MNKPKSNAHIKTTSEAHSGKSFIIPDDFLNIHKPRLMRLQMELGRKAGNRLIVFDRPVSKPPEDRAKALDWIAEGYGVKKRRRSPPNPKKRQ